MIMRSHNDPSLCQLASPFMGKFHLNLVNSSVISAGVDLVKLLDAQLYANKACKSELIFPRGLIMISMPKDKIAFRCLVFNYSKVEACWR